MTTNTTPMAFELAAEPIKLFNNDSVEEVYRLTEPSTVPNSKYTKKDKDGDIVTLADGVIPTNKKFYESEESIMWPTISNERDITKSLGSASTVTIIDLGMGYTDGSSNAMFVLAKAIAEYRANLGLVKAGGSARSFGGVTPCYGRTYISIGIPERAYDWIVDTITQAMGLRLSTSEKYAPKRSKGYVWVTMNMPKPVGPSVYLTVDGRQMQPKTIEEMLTITKRNLIGTATVTLSLKRDSDAADEVYHLGGTYQYLELEDMTDICSPPLNNKAKFHRTGVSLSDSLREMLKIGGSKSMNAPNSMA